MKSSRRSPCPIACTLDLIGDKWTLLIIRDLACGKEQFNEIARSPEKIATNILADRLGKLQTNGLIERRESDNGRDRYALTKKGKSLGPLMQAIATWGLKHIQGTEARMQPVF